MWIVDETDVVAAVVVVVVVVVVRLINVVDVAVAGINASRIASHNIASTKNNTLTNILLRTVLCSVVFLSFWTLLTVHKPYDDAVIRFIYIQHFTIWYTGRSRKEKHKKKSCVISLVIIIY